MRAEKLPLSGGGTDWNNYIFAAGRAVAVFYVRTTGNLTRYLHRDHLGSVQAITDEAGALVEQLAYDAWGKRRFVNGTDDPNNTITSVTDRGFTGHEHLEEVTLIHMNGRIYDPLLGRMMSADVFVQDLLNGQSWNRYTYVINNPLALTDPNGYFFGGLFKAIGRFLSRPRNVIALGVAIFAPGILASQFAITSTVTQGVIAGAVAGGIAGGNLKGVVTGGISGGIFAGVGDIIAGGKFTIFEKAALHAAAGGITSTIQGGDFLSGFVAAGFARLAGPTLADKLGGGKLARGISRVVIGGTAVAIVGGKFENGAVTATFAYLFNDVLHFEVSFELPSSVTNFINDVFGNEFSFKSLSSGIAFSYCNTTCDKFDFGVTASVGIVEVGNDFTAQVGDFKPFSGSVVALTGSMTDLRGRSIEVNAAAVIGGQAVFRGNRLVGGGATLNAGSGFNAVVIHTEVFSVRETARNLRRLIQK